ncbi:diguanylate cyclase [Komagataeibacter rhaeticus]
MPRAGQTAVEASKRRRTSTREIMLVMFDLDGFKPVNDIHGHHAGDVVLKVISRHASWRWSARRTRSAAWAGDEFALILDHTLTRSGRLQDHP